MKNQLNAWFAPQIPVPALHLAVQKMPPVAPVPTLEKTIFNLNLLSATGTALLLAGIASALCLGVGFRRALRIYGQTWLRVRVSLLTISAMMALGFMTRYGGTDTTMGLAMARHGVVVPVLLADHRLARRRAHRQRHLVQRALRQPAEGLRRAARATRRC